jgi:hypothetical protein
MKHIFYRKSLVLFTAMLLIYSCSDQQENDFLNIDGETQEYSYNSNGVKVIDNVVYFRDSKSFSETMNTLVTYNEQSLANWETENGFTTSYRKVLNGSSEDSLAYITETDSAFAYIIESPAFATVVNNEGVFVIGDTIHKITYSTEYMIPELDFITLSGIDSDDITKSVSSNIITFEIMRQRLTSVSLKSAEATESYIVGTLLIKKNSDTDPRIFVNDDGDELAKISAHLYAWCNNYSSYSSIGIKLVGRKKGTWGWRNDDMWYGEIYGETTYFDSYSSSNYTGVIFDKTCSSSGTNVSTVSSDIVYKTGQTYLRCKELSGTYTYEDDGSQQGTWEITWQ